MFKKMINGLMKSIGYVRSEKLTLATLEIRGMEKEKMKLIAKCQELIKINDILAKETAELEDENQSLWGMLDEIHGSTNFGKEQVKSMVKDLEEVLTDEMMKNFKPIGEA
jgi:Fic family protein